jgi:alkylated DNA repair protein (DNA oxidative demethylase)
MSVSSEISRHVARIQSLRYHGVLPLKQDRHPLLGEERINFTFRKAG